MDNQTVDIVEQAKMLMTYKAGIALHKYYMPVIILVGVIGNPISFMVMIQKHNRRISCCVYIACLACTDSLIMVNAICYWLGSGIVHRVGHIECKILVWSLYAMTMSGVFLVVAMTIDRFLAVRFPLTFHSVRTAKHALIIGISIIVLSGIYTCPTIYTAGLLADGACSAQAINDDFAKRYSMGNIFIQSVGPFLTLVILNTLIGVAVHKRNKVNLAGSSNDAKNKSSEQHLIALLFVITIALLVLTLPQFIRHLVAAQIDYQSDPSSYALFMLFYHVSNKMFITNNSVNFILYVMSSRKFREDLKVMFKGKSPRNELSSVSK